MKFYSTNKSAPLADFREATVRGQAPDKGLYFPEIIPAFSKNLIENIASYSKEALALACIKPYIGNTIPADKLEQIVSETINFGFPLVPLGDNISTLELFHGPTLAFKDVGARFMSRCLGHFVQGMDQKVTVLVATSGDTGGAVASGFYGVDGIDVVILYPSGKVSNIQELQLTTLGKNIRALEVEGSFDDCQRMVKSAFADEDIRDNMFLTSANSINVARWLPQQFYYLFAWQQWQLKEPPVIAVPSGNFGNICAGLMAHASGMPVQKFVAACNANDVVPNFLATGTYHPQKPRHTLSNAMDVGDPSNFVRILEIFSHHITDLKKVMQAVSISDAETKATIKQVFEKHHYLLDPHGAVGYLALKNALQHPEAGYFLETAHPVKFHDVVEDIIGEPLPLPAIIKGLEGKEKQATRIKADDAELKNFLLS